MPRSWEKQRKPKTGLTCSEQLLCDLLHSECSTGLIVDSDAFIFHKPHYFFFFSFFLFLSNVVVFFPEASASTDWRESLEDHVLRSLWLNNLCLSTVVVTAYGRCNWFWEVAWICRNETVALVLVHRKSTLLKLPSLILLLLMGHVVLHNV